MLYACYGANAAWQYFPSHLAFLVLVPRNILSELCKMEDILSNCTGTHCCVTAGTVFDKSMSRTKCHCMPRHAANTGMHPQIYPRNKSLVVIWGCRNVVGRARNPHASNLLLAVMQRRGEGPTSRASATPRVYLLHSRHDAHRYVPCYPSTSGLSLESENSAPNFR